MKLMLQSTQNKLFFRYGGVWTADPSQAFDFHQMQNLIEMVEMQSLHDVQAVLKIDDRHPFEIVPLENLPVAATPIATATAAATVTAQAS
jgi:hypothetical protein